MTDQQQQPLWKVVQEIYESNCVSYYDDDGALILLAPEASDYAIIFRAIADRVVPAREFPDGKDDIQKGIWLANNRIRQNLMDEADRAAAER